MTGEPVSSALLLMSAATTGVGLYASSQQEKLDRSINAAETEHARLAGAETALTASRDFRTALSSQLALASLRGGSGGSLAQTFGSRSIANFLSDQRSLESQQKFLGIKSNIRNAEIGSQRLARDVSSVGSLLSTGYEAINLNKISKAQAKT
jgi:hypothetical protein